MATNVFIGNIPYDTSEEQLKSLFSEVGPIQSLRMVFDKDTGRPKGYGFVTYNDRDTASSAVRNLNGYEIKGRQIKVDFSDKEAAPDDAPPPAKRRREDSSDAPLDTTAAIKGFVSSANTQQLLDLFSQIKLLVGTNPIAAKQLTYGLFQAMMTTNIVDSSVLNQLLPQMQQPQPPAMGQQQPGGPIDAQQQQLLMQVLALTPAQIAVLPPNQQEDIRLLKAKFGAQ